MGNIININKKVNRLNGNLGKSTGQKKYNIGSPISVQVAKKYIEKELNYENISETHKTYYKHLKKDGKLISNFIIKLKELIQADDNMLLKCEIERENLQNTDITFKMIDFLNSSNFKRTLALNDISLIFTGNTEDLNNIKGILFEREYKKTLGVNYTGVFKNDGEYVFVGNDSSINKLGKDINDVTYIGNSEIQSTITNILPISKGELKRLAKHIFNFNELGNTATVFGFSSSCFLREKLYLDNGTKSPHLIICGEAGSGKSETLESIIMEVFSMNQKMSADQCSRFVNVNYAGGSNTLPFIIEEYKPSRLSKIRKDEISALLRNAYDRTPGFRGNAQQGLNKYPVVTPIILVGEMAIEESAGLERSILMYFSKQKISSNVNKKSFMYLKKNKGMINRFGRGLLEQALKMDSIALKNSYGELNEEYSCLPNRVRNSAVTCMLGIQLIRDLFEARGLRFEDCTGYNFNTLKDAIKENIVDNVLEGNSEVKGIIEKSMDVLNDMVETGELIKGIDYQVINSGAELALNIKMLYPKLLKYSTSHNLKENDKLSQNEFTKQLRFKEYYIAYKAIRFVHKFEIKNGKAFVFNIAKLKLKACIDNFSY